MLKVKEGSSMKMKRYKIRDETEIDGIRERQK